MPNSYKVPVQAAVGAEVLHGREAIDVVNLVQHRHREDLAHATVGALMSINSMNLSAASAFLRPLGSCQAAARQPPVVTLAFVLASRSRSRYPRRSAVNGRCRTHHFTRTIRARPVD